MNAFEESIANDCKEYLALPRRLQAGDSRIRERLASLVFNLRAFGIEVDPTGQDLRPASEYLQNLGVTDNTQAYEREKSRRDQRRLPKGRFADAAARCEEICDLMIRHSGADNERLDRHLLARAIAYQRAGEFEYAEVLYQEAIERFETYHGSDVVGE